MACIPTCLEKLSIDLDRLRREAESTALKIRYLVSRGDSLFAFQESIQDLERFDKTYSKTLDELSLLLIDAVKINWDLEEFVAENSISDDIIGCGNHVAALFEGFPWNNQSVNINEHQVTSICRLYHLEKESTLEMKYLIGESPSEFWLGCNSDNEFQSHLITIKKRINSGKLHRLSAAPRIGQFIIGYVNSVFRGRVLSTCNNSIVAIDIDRGEIKMVNEHNSWEVGDCLSHFPPQALMCELSSMKHGVEWYQCLSDMFKNCLSECKLVVTVKDIIPGLIPKFVVDVNAYDNINLDLSLNKWLNSYVFPAIEKVDSHRLSDNVNEFFKNINPFVLCKEKTTLNSGNSSESQFCSEEVYKNSVVNSLTSQKMDEGVESNKLADNSQESQKSKDWEEID